MLSMRTFIRTSLAVIAALAATVAVSQDWGTFQGQNGRTGTNGDVIGSGPGAANLRWFYPNAFEPKPSSYIRNNTSGQTGVVGPWFNSTADTQAGDPFSPLPAPGTDPNEGTETGLQPAYLYTNETASQFRVLGQPYDPRIPAVGTARTFTWTFNTGSPNAQSYSLYVWVPQGPTGPTGNIAQPFFYAQRYCVYDIQYGSGQHYVDVVDTWQSGWIRLGNGGAPTTRTFPYNGINPITITLFNTVPRDATGQLLDADPANNNQVNPNGVVYADACMAIPDYGSYTASPTVRLNPNVPIGSVQTRVVAAFNRFVTDTDSNSGFSQVSAGEVSSYDHSGAINLATGTNRIWKFSLANLRTVSVLIDNNDAISAPAAAWTSATSPAPFQGADYYRAPLQGTSLPAAASVTYAPAMADGSYDVQVFLPGKAAPAENVGVGTVVKVFQGAAESDIPVDQTQSGWVSIGQYNHSSATGAPLSVAITNYSADPTDITLGRVAYADAVRFNIQVTPAVRSTPIQVTANVRYDPANPTIVPAVPIPVDVTIIAAEDGHIYCVDTKGNGDGTLTTNGTTNLIWAYPSLKVPGIPDPNTTALPTDPIANKLDGEKGTILAQMPTSFDTSSALVRTNAAGEDLLYIGATNGRVYCIEMAGRGDENVVLGRAGTTKRRWTYPDDYPSIQKSPLGPFHGSVAFATTAAGPTIFAPDSRGRMYALDADGNVATRTTTTRWTFPDLTTPTLGGLWTTPAVAFNPLRVYFGTLKKDDTVPGQIWCLGADNPALNQWHQDGILLPDGSTRLFDDFLSAPAVGTAAELANGTPDSVFFANMNSFVCAFTADGTEEWVTNELGNGVIAPLSLSYLNVFTGVGNTMAMRPILLVPTADNQFAGLFADVGEANIFGGKLAWGYYGEGNNQTAGLSIGRDFMYTGDGAGNFFAWNNTGTGSIGGYGNSPPGAPLIPPNDVTNVDANQFRNVKVKILTRLGARHLLRTDVPTTVAGPFPTTSTDLSYNDIDQDPGGIYTVTITPLAFEWGQRAQIVLYNFPFLNYNASGNQVAPPRVQYVITVDGRDGRPRVVESRQFVSTSVTDPGTGKPLDGYCVIDLPIQGSGPDSVPPGQGRITFTIRTSAISPNGNEQIVALDPTKNYRDFFVANPLGIGMHLINPGSLDVTSNMLNSTAMGMSTLASHPENLPNGSPDVAGKLGSRLGASPGILNHGGSGVAQIYVWDRSLMTELRGPGHGLDTVVRVQSADLAWFGQQSTVFKSFLSNPNTVPFASFEDLPVNFPNNSLDYSDIHRDRFRVVKDPNGTPENPIFSGVSLTPPKVPTDAITGDYINELNRTMTANPFDFQVDVPKYQPSPVLSYNPVTHQFVFPTFTDSAGTALSSGYTAHMAVFVDSNGNGVVDSGRGNREALRTFNYTLGVAPDQRLVVTSPTVDLNSLSAGTGFTPNPPGTAGSSFNPRNAAWSNLFQTFSVINDGNVNALNVRVAKGTAVQGGSINPWALFGDNVDDLAYLNGSLYLFSDIDRNSTSLGGLFKITTNSIAQKPRPNDPSGTQFTPNPVNRVNLNNGIAVPTPFLNPANFPVQSPKIAVGVPIGFPAGTYTNLLRIIEDDNDDELLGLDLSYNGLEPYSDPTLTLKFRVVETQLTTTTKKQTRTSVNAISPADPLNPIHAPMIDNLTPNTSPASLYQYGNAQPAGMRLNSGTLLMAWASNRMDQVSGNPTDTPLQPTSASQNDQWRLYVATLAGTSLGNTGGYTPTRDLDIWAPATAFQWFDKSPSATVGFPVVTTTLFNVQPGETLVPESVKFGNPAFPIQGVTYSLAPTNPYVAFIGTAQKTTGSGQVVENRLFLAQVTVNGGVATVSTPVSMPFDVSSTKGRPSIIQNGQNAIVFYAAGTTSGAQVEFTTFDGTNWTQPVAVTMPSGFESTNAPSVTARPYTDPSVPLLDANGVPFTDVLDVSFTGRLRGRSASEVFTIRLGSRVTAGTVYPAPIAEVFQPTIAREILGADTAAGTFRSVGLGWNPALVITPTQNEVVLEQLAGGVITDLEVPGSRVKDRTTGIISFSSKLGGKVYLDPNLGTVRFTSASPTRNGVLYLTYQPTVLRLSATTTSSYTGSTMMFDHRFVSLGVSGNNLQNGLYGPDFWGRYDGTAAQITDPICNDRYIVMYNRGSAGGGQTARPFMKTLRYGIQLPTAVYARADGSLLYPNNNNPSITVTGLNNGEFYQVDPAKGRVYFEATTEGRAITVNYLPVDGAGNIQVALVVNGNATLITETDEAAIPIENAANEAGLAPFLDPYNPNPNAVNNRRPGLIWMLWSSTRAGNADIFMETIAPRFVPVVGGH